MFSVVYISLAESHCYQYTMLNFPSIWKQTYIYLRKALVKLNDQVGSTRTYDRQDAFWAFAHLMDINTLLDTSLLTIDNLVWESYIIILARKTATMRKSLISNWYHIKNMSLNIFYYEYKMFYHIMNDKLIMYKYF